MLKISRLLCPRLCIFPYASPNPFAHYSSSSHLNFNESHLNAPQSTELLPSHFTGRTIFYETLSFLKDISTKLSVFSLNKHIFQENVNGENIGQEQLQFQWLDKSGLEKKFSMTLTDSEHRALTSMLTKIAHKQVEINQPDLLILLNSFAKGNSFLGRSINTLQPSLDAQSSVSNAKQVVSDWNEKTIGKRKTAVGQVWLYPGTGLMLVNGRPVSDYFQRLKDLYRISLPLEATDRFTVYNIWSIVNGGGPTGQADALMLALAKALVIKEPALHPILEQSGLLKRDIRMVERKKPGQPKARKKFTWVKR